MNFTRFSLFVSSQVTDAFIDLSLELPIQFVQRLMFIVNSASFTQSTTEIFGFQTSAMAGRRELSIEPQNYVRYSGRCQELEKSVMVQGYLHIHQVNSVFISGKLYTLDKQGEVVWQQWQVIYCTLVIMSLTRQ